MITTWEDFALVNTASAEHPLAVIATKCHRQCFAYSPPWLLPSGIQRGLPFILPDDWTPEQALAVVELLDDLRERIWAHYQIPLHNLLREQCRQIHRADDPAADTDDPPF